MFGILNLHKPPAVTSRDVVDRVQRIVRPAKAGHAGTLDPLATGVLLVCVGPATRLIPYLQQLPKTYVATFILGQTSNTDDVEGDIRPLDGAPQPTADAIRSRLPGFRGEIQQVPPAFSAVKVQGKRAYALARAGRRFELRSKPVWIEGIRLLVYNYPHLRLEITCGSGTYIRSVGRDLARELGTEAIMSELVRTRIGEFHLADSCDLDQLTSGTLHRFLLPAARAVAQMPRVELGAEQLCDVGHGRAIADRWQVKGDAIAAFDSAGRLRAILAPAGNDSFRPVRTFPLAEDWGNKRTLK